MSIPTISQRGLNTPESPIRKLAPYAIAAREKGHHVYHLNIGQPDIPTPHEFFEAVHAFDQNVLAYGPSGGIEPFLKSLLNYYHGYGYDHIDKADIMVTTGGSEAVLFSLMAVASPGEEVIVFEPFYPNYNGFSHMAGIKLVPVTSPPETGYHLPSRAEIETAITSRTRAILICSPNNPTGTVLTKDEIGLIESIALKHDLFVLSDEVYREFVFSGSHTSVLAFPDLQNHAVVMDSLSKRYSVCGARVGCLVTKNQEFIQTAMKFGQSRLCPPTLEQIGATALVNEGEKYFKSMLGEYKNRRDMICSLLNAIPGVKCQIPNGAFYIMVQFPVESIEKFAQWLLSDFDLNGETTMMAPGPGFYATSGKGIQEARIAYVLKSEDLEKAVAVIRKGLEVYNGQ